MSYRKAWLLVKDMNNFFKEPLVIASKGGAKGGGARVTEMGCLVLKKYRYLETAAWESVSNGVREFEGLLSKPKAI
jgi:molybdate transport system regulatory protein